MDQLLIHEIFSNVAAQYASHVALDQGSRPPVTYGELEDESNRLANFLISSGAEPGSIVAIMADPDAIVESGRLPADDDDNWRPRKSELPPVGAPVKVIFTFDSPPKKK